MLFNFVFVIVILIYSTLQRSVIGNRTFGYRRSDDTTYNSYCYIKINYLLYSKRIKYYI